MGKVVHFEIPADDVKRASEFYKKVFDWEMTAVPEMDYTMVTSGPKTDQDVKWPFINGGMMKRTAGISSPVVVMDVKDLNATLKLLEENGGKIIKGSQSVGDMGFIAYVTDSENNVVGVWQNAK